jgi:putative tricarboxylic transport membrane protein
MIAHILESIGAAAVVVSTPENFLWIFFGTLAGIIIGAIPGIGSALGCALALPFTVYLDPLAALLFITTLYGGAMYGGSIPSILMNTPGDGAAAASTIEGFPMAKNGKAVTALTVSATASALGGMIGSVIAILGSAVMLPFLLLFGTAEYFLLGVFGIVLVALVSKGAFYKALLSGIFGLSVTLIGIAPGGSAEVRYTFNLLSLYDGISFLPILLGLFGVATMAGLYAEKSGSISALDIKGGKRVEGVMITLTRWVILLKSSVIGFLIGAIPGTGGTVASFISYGEAVRSGKPGPVPFGQGNPSGLVATESSNNACSSGALVPTLLFGIPGSATTAILLAAMLIHGLRPGTAMFEGDGYVTTISLFLGLVYCSVIITVVGLGMVRTLGKLTVISKHLIIPGVLMLSLIGIFTYHFNWLDVFVMVGAGVVGFLMTKFGFPVIPAVIGVVLGQIIEENLLRALELGGGSLWMLVERPISLLLLVLTILMVALPAIAALRAKSDDKSRQAQP